MNWGGGEHFSAAKKSVKINGVCVENLLALFAATKNARKFLTQTPLTLTDFFAVKLELSMQTINANTVDFYGRFCG